MLCITFAGAEAEPAETAAGHATSSEDAAVSNEARGAETTEQEASAAPDLVTGQEIVSIVFLRRNMFDTTAPKTSSWPYRWANALHILSRESFIRSMLLFREGDPWDPDLAAETARILRELNVMNPVEITAAPIAGGVEVTVDTRDQWTTKVGGRFSLFGDRTRWGLNFSETNFLGRGWDLSVAYRSDEERDTWSYGLSDPNILGSRWRAKIAIEKASDGHTHLLVVDRPFYSLATRHAWGGSWLDTELTEYLYGDTQPVVSGRTEFESLQLWGGVRLPSDDDSARRLIGGYAYSNSDFAEWVWDDGSPYPQPEPIKVSGPRVSYHHTTDDYLVLQGFRSWHVQEDVAMGPNFDVGLTASIPILGADRARFLFDSSFSAASRRNDWMLLADAWTSGRIENQGFKNTVLGFQISAAQIGDRGWQASLRAETSHELDRNLQLTLGADTGLRGWDPDTFDGTGRAVANVQWRAKLADDVLNLVSLGILVFADAGYTWGARVGRPTERIHGDVGIGLLAGLTHLGNISLLRIEVAMPDDGSGFTVLVTTQPLF